MYLSFGNNAGLRSADEQRIPGHAGIQWMAVFQLSDVPILRLKRTLSRDYRLLPQLIAQFAHLDNRGMGVLGQKGL